MKLFLSIALLTTTTIFGQKKEIKIDRITGDTVAITKWEKLFGKPSLSGTAGEQLNFSCIEDKNGIMLVFSVQTGKTSIFSIDENDKLYIKTEDNNVLTLSALTDNVSNYIRSSYGSTAKAFYKPTLAD